MPERELEITLTLKVNLNFLARYPCTTDWSGLFGRLDRAHLHQLIGEQDPLLGNMLIETTRFFVDKTTHAETEDAETYKRLVAEGEHRKNQIGRHLQASYDF